MSTNKAQALTRLPNREHNKQTMYVYGLPWMLRSGAPAVVPQVVSEGATKGGVRSGARSGVRRTFLRSPPMWCPNLVSEDFITKQHTQFVWAPSSGTAQRHSNRQTATTTNGRGRQHRRQLLSLVVVMMKMSSILMLIDDIEQSVSFKDSLVQSVRSDLP